MTPTTPPVPRYYTAALGRAICTQVATTPHGLRHICRQAGMPHYNTVYKWLTTHAAFRSAYYAAKAKQALLGKKKTKAEGVEGMEYEGVDYESAVRTLESTPPAQEALADSTPTRITYSNALADRICAAIAGSTATLHDVCTAPGMPHVATVFKWIKRYPYFTEAYALAKASQADFLTSVVLHIACDGNAHLTLAEKRLQIQVHKWMAGRLTPHPIAPSRPASTPFTTPSTPSGAPSPAWATPTPLPDWITTPAPTAHDTQS